MTSPDMTKFWSDRLLASIQDRDWAESMLDGRMSSQEIRVTAIAIVAIDVTLAHTLHMLGGLAATW